MLLADTPAGRQAPEATGERAICPMCGQTLIAKCGPIYVNHWAHEGSDCDSWAEEETAWHRAWKERFPAACREVVISPHRADVRTSRGWILEFQNSPLEVSAIFERERFYGTRLIWVLNGHGWAEKNFHFRPTQKHGPAVANRTPVTFRWLWPRQRWLAAGRPLFIDLDGEILLRIMWFSEETPTGGWGTLTSAQALAEWAETGRPIEQLPQPARNPLAVLRERQRRRAERQHPFWHYRQEEKF